ncbi:MAG: carboxypeptidase regulatory-like domain-containing protein [Bacteroidales bacterium]|nr:carboxypeptidase regulatory-like domain-containing protein [Bacteroidales bacterium]
MKKAFLRFIIICLSFNSIFSISVSQSGPEEELVSRLYEKSGEQYFSFHLDDQAVIRELSRLISIDRIVPGEGTVYAYANKKEFLRFLDFGIPYEILSHPGNFSGFLNMKSEVDIRDIQEWDFYPTFDAYVDMMYQYAAAYPELCQVSLIGTSGMGRELLVARISDNIGINENEPQFLYTSSIHGDETTGYILMLRLIDYLLSNYGTDPRITEMVDNMDIWINPLANPDGTYHGGNGTVNNAFRYNANWVDLNRNYPDPEDGMHPDGEDWQTETIHFMEFAENNHFVASANLHGGTAVCNYPWDTWSRLSADDNWWKYVCREYADTVHANCPWGYMTGYDNGITNGYAWYTISGGRQDYMNYFHQCREFTLEISNTKLLQPDSLPMYWEYNYRSLLNYMEQTRFGVHGTVKDSITGWPVLAEVYIPLHDLDSSWVYTALPNGDFHRLLAEGTYSLRFSAPNYQTKIVSNVTVTKKQVTTLNIKLVPSGVGGIDNNEVSQMVQVFPNPAHNGFIYFKSDIPVTEMKLYDLSGKEVCLPGNDITWKKINIEQLDPGIYFIWFNTDKGAGLKKIAITR